MLHEMYPKRVSKYQFRFTAIGVVVGWCRDTIIFESNFIFKVGVTLLIIGSFYMLLGVKKMLSYGRKES